MVWLWEFLSAFDSFFLVKEECFCCGARILIPLRQGGVSCQPRCLSDSNLDLVRVVCEMIGKA